ncbi:retropepsin-like aspartic protease [Neptuniibacter sp. SY11_33]|uniref:retropepsin-like aspartic protease n=1 Tax=Neptuniibacter sp. SY11_33 TaxID=3398215 RepID=UPI0039F5FE71
MDRKLLLMPLLSALLIMPTLAEARIYEYVDDNGRKVFVDRLSKIPAKYRDQMETREERKDKLEPLQLEAQQQRLSAEQSQIELDKARTKIQEAMKKWVTPFQFHANRIVVPVKVFYGARSLQLSLVMDTGASSTVVHKQAISALRAQTRRGAAARIADGSVIDTERVHFDRVEIGPYQAKGVTAGVLDYQGGSAGTDGLLGMDFLYQARYEIDREKKHIVWNPERYQELQDQLVEVDRMEQELKGVLAAPDPENQKNSDVRNNVPQ